jgi:ribonuclease VapC
MPLLIELLSVMDVEVIPFTEAHSRAAVEAFLRFGKGRHPAALNYGDCLTYAVAATAGQPLLYVGEDFTQTGIARA